MIDEREFEIINILASRGTTTQRQLAARTHLSLGLINILLKRLALKGFLRARQLDRRKVEYLLTPHGMLEKAKKSYRYTLKTMESFDTLRQRIGSILQTHSGNGYRAIHILGRGPLADFAYLVLKDQVAHRFSVRVADQLPAKLSTDTLWLDASAQIPAKRADRRHVIHLLGALSGPLEREIQ